MKKFDLQVSVQRTEGHVTTVVETSGNLTKKEAEEAIGVVREAVVAEEDDQTSYNGSLSITSEDGSKEEILVSSVKKATVLEIIAMMQPDPVEDPIPAPTTEVSAAPDAPEADEQPAEA